MREKPVSTRVRKNQSVAGSPTSTYGRSSPFRSLPVTTTNIPWAVQIFINPEIFFRAALSFGEPKHLGDRDANPVACLNILAPPTVGDRGLHGAESRDRHAI